MGRIVATWRPSLPSLHPTIHHETRRAPTPHGPTETHSWSGVANGRRHLAHSMPDETKTAWGQPEAAAPARGGVPVVLFVPAVSARKPLRTAQNMALTVPTTDSHAHAAGRVHAHAHLPMLTSLGIQRTFISRRDIVRTALRHKTGGRIHAPNRTDWGVGHEGTMHPLDFEGHMKEDGAGVGERHECTLEYGLGRQTTSVAGVRSLGITVDDGSRQRLKR